jgi:hypothetical protein
LTILLHISCHESFIAAIAASAKGHVNSSSIMRDETVHSNVTINKFMSPPLCPKLCLPVLGDLNYRLLIVNGEYSWVFDDLLRPAREVWRLLFKLLIDAGRKGTVL